MDLAEHDVDMIVGVHETDTRPYVSHEVALNALFVEKLWPREDPVELRFF